MSNWLIQVLNDSDYLFISQRDHLHHSDLAFAITYRCGTRSSEVKESCISSLLNFWELVNTRNRSCCMGSMSAYKFQYTLFSNYLWLAATWVNLINLCLVVFCWWKRSSKVPIMHVRVELALNKVFEHLLLYGAVPAVDNTRLSSILAGSVE